MTQFFRVSRWCKLFQPFLLMHQLLLSTKLFSCSSSSRSIYYRTRRHQAILSIEQHGIAVVPSRPPPGCTPLFDISHPFCFLFSFSTGSSLLSLIFFRPINGDNPYSLSFGQMYKVYYLIFFLLRIISRSMRLEFVPFPVRLFVIQAKSFYLFTSQKLSYCYLFATQLLLYRIIIITPNGRVRLD